MHLLLALNKERKGLRRQLSENYIDAIVNCNSLFNFKYPFIVSEN